MDDLGGNGLGDVPLDSERIPHNIRKSLEEFLPSVPKIGPMRVSRRNDKSPSGAPENRSHHENVSEKQNNGVSFVLSRNAGERMKQRKGDDASIKNPRCAAHEPFVEASVGMTKLEKKPKTASPKARTAARRATGLATSKITSKPPSLMNPDEKREYQRLKKQESRQRLESNPGKKAAIAQEANLIAKRHYRLLTSTAEGREKWRKQTRQNVARFRARRRAERSVGSPSAAPSPR